MKPSLSGLKGVIPSVCLIVVFVVLLVVTNDTAKARRILPPEGQLVVIEVPTQSDAYAVYKSLGLRGAEVMHFSRHFNMVPYFPDKQHVPVWFPIIVEDVRPLYEEGVDSHSWLFVAYRTGLVRKITTVLPEDLYSEMVGILLADFEFKKHGDGFVGYTYEHPRAVYGLGKFTCPDGPVVVNVDASIFSEVESPESLRDIVKGKCPDIRAVLLISSVDEPEVTEAMRTDLASFGDLVRGIGI